MEYGIAIDLGATNIRVAAGTAKGEFIARAYARTNLFEGAEAISLQIISMIRRLQDEAGLALKDMVGIGVGAFGPQDPVRGGIVKPANAPYEFIPIRKPLEEAFKVPVEVYNDCVASVIGEKFYGLGKNVDNIVYITISTGIGAGVYVDRRLLLGKDGNAHEIGHIVVDCEGRLICGCGKRGHWEAYCSGRNIPNFAKLIIETQKRFEDFKKSYLWKASNNSLDGITAKSIYDGAKMGDKLCIDIVENIGVLNAMGVASAINVYDPDLVTLGGAVTLNNVEQVLNPIKKHFKEYIVNREAEIAVTPLGDDIGLYGALALAFRLHKDKA
jgi:glucokinase